RRGAAERRRTGRAVARRARRHRLETALFPGVEQAFDMAALIARERHVREQPAHLGWVVVLDCGLEMLAARRRLLKLAPEPAEKADLRRPAHSVKPTERVSPSSPTDPP